MKWEFFVNKRTWGLEGESELWEWLGVKNWIYYADFFCVYCSYLKNDERGRTKNFFITRNRINVKSYFHDFPFCRHLSIHALSFSAISTQILLALFETWHFWKYNAKKKTETLKLWALVIDGVERECSKLYLNFIFC